jgi:hypothetical protein
MCALESKSKKTKPLMTPQARLAFQAMREAQRFAIKEDIRYGLKPVILANPVKKTRSGSGNSVKR